MKNKNVFVTFAFILLLGVGLVSSASLPTIGGDTNNWGTKLNEFLNVSLAADGSLNEDIVQAGNLNLSDIDNSNFSNGAGYMTSYTETDSVFIASAASLVNLGDVNDWNTSYAWGDHSLVGYLTSEQNPSNATIEITESQISDLQTYLTSYTETDSVFLAMDTLAELNTQLTDATLFTGAHTVDTDTQLNKAGVEALVISVTESQISDLQTYLTAETDPKVSGGSANKLVCWKTATTMGYCSDDNSDGTCTCV